MGDAAKRFYPAFLDLDRRLCVVIGQGRVAEKRARQLVRYGADVVVICPTPSEELLAAEADGDLTVEQRDYVRGDLAGAALVLCVSNDEEVARAVFSEADSVGCLVNVSGAPDLSSFILPSVVHRAPLQIAISTGGTAPQAAKALRREIEAAIGEEWSLWIALLAAVRAEAAAVDDPAIGARALDLAARDATRERLAAGEEVGAEQVLAEARAELEDEVARDTTAQAEHPIEPADTPESQEVTE